MKKYFLFAAVAGMLASCSSESLTAGSDPTIEPTQEERVPIKLGVTSPSVRATTRGTGTVGGVGTSDPNNVWAGQEIHAFMFKKGEAALTPATETDNSTILYKNALMITPGVATNKTPGGSSSTDIGEAMLSDGAIKYYPPKGNFDFFGYHGDDATGALNESSTTLWTVPFTITGSQDLMSTKAKLLEQTSGTIKQVTAMDGSEDYYSAKAARKGVQPILQFDHLLTRLSFVVVPGNDNAGGWVATIPAVLYADAAEYNAAKGTILTDGEFAALSDEDKIKTPAVAAHQDATKAVYVKKITVNSKTKGDMAVAWTDDGAPTSMITWNDTSDGDLELQERPISLISTPATTITKTAYDALPDGPVDGDANDKTDYFFNPSLDLVALTQTCPKMTHAYDPANKEETSVGEALIVAPKKAEAYKMKVTVVQKVPTNWNTIDDPSTYVDKEMTYDLDIAAPGDAPGEFKANTSYKVILTVYGFERIQVTTMIIPWETGANIEVGQD